MKLGLDGKPLLHCIQCGRGYGYWQIKSTEVCLDCGEPLIFVEEGEQE